MGPVIALFLCALAICNASTGIGFVPVGKHLVYDYSSEVTVGTREPALFQSRYGIRAKLHVQGSTEVKGLVGVKLTDVTFTLNNGKVPPRPIDTYLPIAAESEVLTKPFQIRYDLSGKVVGINTDKVDKEWSINIKQGIASLLQLDTQVITTETVGGFLGIVTEETLYGRCDVTYQSTRHGEGIKLRKSQDPKACRTGTTTGVKDNVLTTDSTRDYYMEKTDGAMVIRVITADGKIIAAPFHATSTVQISKAFQMLHLLEVVDIKDQITLELPRVITGLKYINPIAKCVDASEVDHLDITGGRATANFELVLSKIYKLLEEVNDFIDINHITLEKYDNKHYQVLNRLLILLQQLDLASLERCFALLNEHKETLTEKNKLDIFLVMVPKTGTKAAAVFIRNVIRKGKLTDTMAIKLIQEVPLHIRCPTEKLLIELEDLLTIVPDVDAPVYRASALAFASLISKTFVDVDTKSELLEKYITLFVTKMRTTVDYKTKMLYMNCLSNIQVKSVLKHLDEIITGHEVVSEDLRVLSLWAVAGQFKDDHLLMLKYMLPIIADQSLSVELRLTAYSIFIRVEDHLNRFMDLYWLMQAETNEYVYNFHYNTLTTLANTKLALLQKKADIARLLLRISRKPVKSQIGYGIFLNDFVDDKLSYGGMIKNVLISSGTVKSMYFGIKTIVNGIKYNPLSIGIKVRGTSTLNKKSGIKTPLLETPHKTVDNEEFHMEIILKRNNRVVMTYVYNKDTVDEVFKVLKDLENMARGINTHTLNIVYPINLHQVFPNDLGVPVIYYNRVPIMPIFNLKIVHDESRESRLVLNIEADIKLLSTGTEGLTVYNPINDLYHGVTKTKIVSVGIPLRMQFKLDQAAVVLLLKQGEIKDAIGVQSYVNTDVNIFGENSRDLLTKCDEESLLVTRVTKGDFYKQKHVILDEEIYAIGKKLQVALYDCEHPISAGGLVKRLETLLLDRPKPERVIPLADMLLSVMNIYKELIVTPGSASCGIGMRLVPSVEVPVDYLRLEVKFSHTPAAVIIPSATYPEFALESEVLLTLHGANDIILRYLETYFMVHFGKEHADNKYAIHSVRKITGKPDFKFDIDVEQKYVTEGTVTKAKLTVGEPDKLAVVNVDVKGLLSDEQKLISADKKFTYEECIEELSERRAKLPISLACSIEATTLRKYLIDITTNDVENRFVKDLLNLRHGWFLEYLPYLHRKIKDEVTVDEKKIHVEVTLPMATKDVDVVIETPHVKDTYIGLPLWKHFWSVFFKPTNIHFPLNFYQQMLMDKMRTCVADDYSILTESNRIVTSSLTNEWQLYASDAVENSTFAIYFKRLEEYPPLGLKIKVDDDVLEVIPEEDAYVFIANGKKLPVFTTGYHVESFFSYTMNQHPKLVVISTHKHGLFIEGDGVTIRMHFLQPSSYPQIGKCVV